MAPTGFEPTTYLPDLIFWLWQFTVDLALTVSPRKSGMFYRALAICEIAHEVELLTYNSDRLKCTFYLFQYVCILSVFLLTAECTSLTVTLVLTLRKFLSLIFSVVYFSNPFTWALGLGAVLVFGGSTLFSDAPKILQQRLQDQIEKLRNRFGQKSVKVEWFQFLSFYHFIFILISQFFKVSFLSHLSLWRRKTSSFNRTHLNCHSVPIRPLKMNAVRLPIKIVNCIAKCL